VITTGFFNVYSMGVDTIFLSFREFGVHFLHASFIIWVDLRMSLMFSALNHQFNLLPFC